MDKFVIEGGCCLFGEIVVLGVKNVVLLILCVGLFIVDLVDFDNVLNLKDVCMMLKVLN